MESRHAPPVDLGRTARTEGTRIPVTAKTLMKPAGIDVRILTSNEEIEGYRSVWESMHAHPNADIDLFMTIASVRPEVIRPHVVVLLQDGSPVSMAVGRLEDTHLQLAVGYRKLAALPMRAVTVVYGGVVGDAAFAEPLLDALWAPLKERQADVLTLPLLDLQSPLLALAGGRQSRLLRARFDQPTTHRQMLLPNSIDEFLARFSKKQRYNLKRPRNLLERRHPREVEWKCYSSIDDVDRFRSEAERVARGTYQRALGRGFANDDEHARRLALAAERGWLRGYVLHAAGEPIAFWMCTLYKGVLHLDSTGYSAMYRDVEPGKILFLELLQHQCETRECERIDFGLGDGDYKRRYADVSWEEQSVQLFAPSAKGLALNSLRLGPQFLEWSGRRLVRGLGLERRVKRAWRDRKAATEQGKSKT